MRRGNSYYLWSSVLGKVITELYPNGEKQFGYVYLGGQVLAKQSYLWVVWQHDNPISGSRASSSRDGGYGGESQPDPMGVNVGVEDPYVNCCPPPEESGTIGLLAGSGIPNGRCTLDGLAIDCAFATEIMTMGAAVVCPDNDCGPRWNPNVNNGNGSRGAWEYFHAFANGYSGWMTRYGLANYEGGRDFYRSGYENHMEYRSRLSRTLNFGPPMRRGQPQYYWLQTPNIAILDRVEMLMQKPDCAKFLNGVLTELGKATGRGREGVTFESLFKMARNRIGFDPNHPSRGSASIDGILIGHPLFKITILLRPEVRGDFTSAPTTIMHEIIHASGREGGNNYTHFEMARAAHVVGSAMGLLDEHDFGLRGDQAIPNPGQDAAKTLLEKKTINSHNSTLFEALLYQACVRH